MKRYLKYILLSFIAVFMFSGCISKTAEASLHNNFNAVKADIDKGISKDDIADTTVFATRHDDLKILKYLIEEKNVDVDIYSLFMNRTPLSIALEEKRIKTIKYLVEHGADVNYMTKGIRPISHYAFWHTRFNEYTEDDILAIVKYLVKNGLDLNARDDFKKTLLDRAKDYEYFKVEGYLKNQARLDQQVVANQKKESVLEEEIANLERENNLKALKEYTDKNPASVYFIKDDALRLALTGPKGLKVGDIRKLLSEGKSELIIVSLIKRVKEPYKEFTLEEIEKLLKMGLSDKIVSTMIDRTTKLLEDEQKRKEQEVLLSEQKKIQKGSTTIINNTTVNKSSNSGSNALQDELINQGVNKLLDHLF